MEEKLVFINKFSELEGKIIELSNNIFDNPEFGYHEEKSSAFLKNFLKKEGFLVEENVAGIATAFKAVYGKGKPVIGLLAEYDALSGISQEAGVAYKKPIEGCDYGHGCGHNLLGAGCVYTGVLVKRYLEETKQEGTIIVFGCPAEEFGSGKAFLAREGIFNGLDAAFTWHPAEYTCVVPASTMSNIHIKYNFIGTAAHASTAPHMGRSALDAVELMNVGANYLREHISRDAQLHYAITDTGGMAPNIVQSHACVLYMIRAPKVHDVLKIKERVDDVARGACLMTGTRVEIEVIKACSHFMPNGVLLSEIYKSIDEIGLPKFDNEDIKLAKSIRETTPTQEESTGLAKNLIQRFMPKEKMEALSRAFCEDINTIVLKLPKMTMNLPGSSDCGDVSLNCPTVWLNYVSYAQGTPAHSWQMVAQGKSSLAHKGMIQAGKTLANAIFKLYEDSAILSSAWTEFSTDTQGKPYVSPIPSDVKIPY